MSRLRLSQPKTIATRGEVLPLPALQKLAAQSGPRFWEILAGIFDGLDQGIIVTDRTGQVVVFNRAAEQIMAYRADEIIGRSSLWDFCEECNHPPLFRESLMQGNSFPEEEVEMSDKHNRTVGVKVTALYAEGGRLEGALATIRSLDEIRQREQEQKSLVRLASIGRIISAVAHEINNPLQTVRTSLELALDPRKSQERRRHYLQTADQEISRIAQIIRQMRAFYRPTPGEKQQCNLNDKLHDAIHLLEKPLSEANVKVELALDPSISTISLIDYQLEQVLLNLILNAIETMPDGGQLVITTSYAEAGRIAISFTDNSSSLAHHQLERVFDPLENRRNTGLGIGLSVSREIISEMGGTVEISAENGTTLTVYLPT